MTGYRSDHISRAQCELVQLTEQSTLVKQKLNVINTTLCNHNGCVNWWLLIMNWPRCHLTLRPMSDTQQSPANLLHNFLLNKLPTGWHCKLPDFWWVKQLNC